jgi:NADPH:quinone reductase-like Zn-dependent oxidoreductase
VTSSGRYEILKVPSQRTLGEFDVMISTRAVGLNPIDWKSVDMGICLPEFPWITGREMTGVVERVGAGVRDLSPGDRVWTSKSTP